MSSVTMIAGLSSHKHVVRMGDMKTTDKPEAELVTYSMGLCLGVSLYHPVEKVGGLLHVMLPSSSIDPKKAAKLPCLFVDTALPIFFREVCSLSLGIEKTDLEIKLVGGADLIMKNPVFNVGQRNYRAVKNYLDDKGLNITAESVGGHISRTMRLNLATGEVVVEVAGQEIEVI